MRDHLLDTTTLEPAGAAARRAAFGVAPTARRRRRQVATSHVRASGITCRSVPVAPPRAVGDAVAARHAPLRVRADRQTVLWPRMSALRARAE